MKLISKIKQFFNTNKSTNQFVNHVVLNKNRQNVIIIKSDNYRMPPSKLHDMLNELKTQYKDDGYDVSFIVI